MRHYFNRNVGFQHYPVETGWRSRLGNLGVAPRIACEEKDKYNGTMVKNFLHCQRFADLQMYDKKQQAFISKTRVHTKEKAGFHRPALGWLFLI